MSKKLTSNNKRYLAILAFPGRMADKIVKAQSIVDKMTNNANFPTPVPALSTVQADLTAFSTNEAAAKSRAKAAVEARNASLTLLKKDLHALLLYVQGIADANSANAATIIEGAGFSTKKAGSRTKADLTLKAGTVSGTVLMTARGAGSRSAHQWQMSKDQLTWTDLPMTIVAKTTVVGLTYGTTMFFRERAIITTGPLLWTSPVSIVIQ
jgi:hypothetical protein